MSSMFLDHCNHYCFTFFFFFFGEETFIGPILSLFLRLSYQELCICQFPFSEKIHPEMQKAKVTHEIRKPEASLPYILCSLWEPRFNQDEQKLMPCSVVALHDLPLALVNPVIALDFFLPQHILLIFNLNNFLGCLVSISFLLVGTLEAKNCLNSIQMTNF